ncbi:phosphoribosyl-AMP cyclohydrolase [Listeria monocytogenes]|nr:phosphoribosyl-AMP cyclohydrolase [Listeria monocytogenes]
MSACRAFIPKFVSGARKKPSIASFKGFLITFFVHISEH